MVQSQLKRECSVQRAYESGLHCVDIGQEECCGVWDAEQVDQLFDSGVDLFPTLASDQFGDAVEDKAGAGVLAVVYEIRQDCCNESKLLVREIGRASCRERW